MFLEKYYLKGRPFTLILCHILVLPQPFALILLHVLFIYLHINAAKEQMCGGCVAY